MDPPRREKIKTNLVHSLRQFLSTQNEKSLVGAYEFGRSTVSSGLGQLEVINIFKETLLELKSAENGDQSINLTIALDFLAECLAPYELRERGFHDLIKKHETYQKQLQKEIERRKHSETELKISKEHFQHLIENSLDIITVLNSDFTIRYMSPSLKRILGYEPGDILYKNVFKYIHPDDTIRTRQKMTAVLKSAGNMDAVEFRCKHKNGSWRYLESIVKYVVDPMDGPGIIVNSRDTTERVLNRKKLEKIRNQLSQAQQIGKIGSWDWDIKTNKLTWSEELCRIYGVSSDSYPESYEEFLQLVHPEDREKAEKVITEAFSKKEKYSFVHRIIRPDNKVRILNGRGEVETDKNGEPVKMIGTGQDITELKETEQKLRTYSLQLKNLSARQEKIRETERIRIARDVHDELGQMLTVLKMNVSLTMKRREKEYGKQFVTKHSGEIVEILDGIDAIIKSVQRITMELRPDVLVDFGLKEALDWQCNELQEQTGIEIKFGHSDHSFDQLNEEQSTSVFQIFQEIFTNIMRHAEASKAEVYLEEADDSFILTVRDNGRGITNKDIEHPGSLGILGMKERTDIIGGNITFNGQPGQGTIVTLKIPVTGNQPPLNNNYNDNLTNMDQND